MFKFNYIAQRHTHTHTQKKIVSKHSFYSYGEFQKTFFFLNIFLANWSARDLNECFSDSLKIKTGFEISFLHVNRKLAWPFILISIILF